ncbi:MAG TPA: hydroxymethylbilane synthase [Bacteroidota bacterium]|nr:hydroxymethylbilane synthase [Bacteroidota bacterium]
MNPLSIIIGSRGSELALWQTNWATGELKRLTKGLIVETIIMKTIGDKILDSSLSKIGDRGLFTKELDSALLEKTIDCAVHSMKDVPTVLAEGLAIGAITHREDVRDAFVCHPNKPWKSHKDLPQGATIATGSLRRRSQLMRFRSDLHIEDLRGNIGTRLQKLDESNWDGIVLASAGLKRLGLAKRITEFLPAETILPAVGQGALAIVIRKGDKKMEKIVRQLHHEPTAVSVRAERAFMRFLEGGCQVPIGTFARFEDNNFVLNAMIGSLDGKKIVSGKTHSDADGAERSALELARSLYQSGGKEILAEIRGMESTDIAV